MPERRQPPALAPTGGGSDADKESSSFFDRSPHPYHRQNFELLHPSDSLAHLQQALPQAGPSPSPSPSPSPTKGSAPASESGTEADDENFLKRLPAPRVRLHKGLRGRNEALSGASTPLLSPALLEEEGRTIPSRPKRDHPTRSRPGPAESSRRRKEIIRRSTEVLLLLALAYSVYRNENAQPSFDLWQRDIAFQSLLNLALFGLYPLRLAIWAYRWGTPSKTVPIFIPSSFDPAPILYPQLIPIFISLLVAPNVPSTIPSNLVLSLSTIPRSLIPGTRSNDPSDALHWLLSCAPAVFSSRSLPLRDTGPIPQEVLVLLYPLHQQLCRILHSLTTTSLLPAELQLLSVGLINILVLSYSPQVTILGGVLWGGGLGIIIFCSSVIRRGIALARVPKWRFKRASAAASKGSRVFRALRSLLPYRNRPPGIPRADFEDSTDETYNSSEEDFRLHHQNVPVPPPPGLRRVGTISGAELVPELVAAAEPLDAHSDPPQDIASTTPPRRHTLPSLERVPLSHKTHTPSGRRKRATSSTVRAFFSLTQAQATVRKWVYAGYVYLTVLALILVGIREYVKSYALSGYEPVGWALGYLFGDMPWFRFQVVKANLEWWIALPSRPDGTEAESCGHGWVQHLRHASLGEANTRLVLSGYWLAIVITGMAIVSRLSPIFEVDTRRKVFHFMMVAMFLPTIYVDPAYAALALSLVLAIFLLLDLLRASQLPPLSKPIAAFLTPYVDGRDLRGPVVISHIFLLIGCAIPLWLSLAALPRSGYAALAGWEVPARDVSMVSGVVCVGLGDSAASLIGRRWGHRKWVWGGGKSLEGSAAFAVAVFVGLSAASLWLRAGGWPSAYPAPMGGAATNSPSLLPSSWWEPVWSSSGRAGTAWKTGTCASLASLTEAVLTGGNDNVVVPVVLWTCIKSMGI